MKSFDLYEPPGIYDSLEDCQDIFRLFWISSRISQW